MTWGPEAGALTWRAFIIGLLGVIGLNLLTPVNDYAVGNTFLTGNHFPVGVFFFLLVLVLGANVALKLVRRAWALRQAELMLVWCMMLVSATVPASGLMRYWFTTAAAAPYLAQRADLVWEDDVLPQAPEGILLSKSPHSVAARKFYQGTPEGEVVRVPWDRWWPVIRTWGVFIWLYYLATFFLFGLLRRQWVDAERLSFPLARVPLEFTEGAGERALLPALVRSRAFLVGAAVTVAFGVIRILPVFFGAEEGMRLLGAHQPDIRRHQLVAPAARGRLDIPDRHRLRLPGAERHLAEHVALLPVHRAGAADGLLPGHAAAGRALGPVHELAAGRRLHRLHRRRALDGAAPPLDGGAQGAGHRPAGRRRGRADRLPARRSGAWPPAWPAWWRGTATSA